MQEVRLDLATHDELQDKVRTRNARIDALEQELAQVKEDHEAEIEKMAHEGKVRCISIKRHPLIPFLVSDKKVYVGFDDVKAEVEEHFKQGLFDGELEKQKKEQLDNLIKQAAERKKVIDDLREEIEGLRHRSLWKRIWNK